MMQVECQQSQALNLQSAMTLPLQLQQHNLYQAQQVIKRFPRLSAFQCYEVWTWSVTYEQGLALQSSSNMKCIPAHMIRGSLSIGLLVGRSGFSSFNAALHVQCTLAFCCRHSCMFCFYRWKEYLQLMCNSSVNSCKTAQSAVQPDHAAAAEAAHPAAQSSSCSCWEGE